MVEPPYGIICNHLKNGEVVPFLGAGASLSGRPPGVEWDEKVAKFLPTGKDLANLLAGEAEFPSPDPHDREDLAKVASFYLEQSNRRSLLARLHEIFNRPYNVGEVHRFLADIPVPLLIVTTNYDDLIEQAFRAKKKPYHLVVHPTERKDLAASVLWWKPHAVEPKACPPNQLGLSVEDTTIIYKIHGSIDRHDSKWDSYVISEDDYVDFLSRMTGQTAIPSLFMDHFRTRYFLFLGYGLADWNLRVVLKNLRKVVARLKAEASAKADRATEDTRSWAIQYQPSDLERMLWQARRVNIYDMEIDEFIARMRGRYGEPLKSGECEKG